MSDLYSIKKETLTDIGDALRRRHGETKVVKVIEEQVVPSKVISKTPNATGFDSFSGSYDTGLTVNEFTYAFTEVHIPNAKSIKLKIAYDLYKTYTTGDSLLISKGQTQDKYVPQNIIKDVSMSDEEEIEVTGTEYITFRLTLNSSVTSENRKLLGYYAEIWGLDENGNPIGDQTIEVEVEREVSNTYSSDEMAGAIDAIKSGTELPEEAFIITGACNYKFAYGGWDWFIEEHGSRITTKDVTNGTYMFSGSHVTDIPFAINSKSATNVAISNMFNNCESLKAVPKINNLKVYESSNLFSGCNNLREIPDDIDATWDWSYMDTLSSAYSGNRSYLFQNCYSLRKYPNSFLSHGNPVIYYSYSIYNYLFSYCSALDEVLDLPFPHFDAVWTSNVFNKTFERCNRAKNITFATQEDGSPFVMQWKSQTINLNEYVGYTSFPTRTTDYNSGITADKEVKDDATYQALKEDPDWFSTNISYSRYNHDSAYRTILSLPDTSAYLASAGGTNTIKFKKGSGALTDGGAVDDLTAEEIAVATAKGWTVSFA